MRCKISVYVLLHKEDNFMKLRTFIAAILSAALAVTLCGCDKNDKDINGFTPVKYFEYGDTEDGSGVVITKYLG